MQNQILNRSILVGLLIFVTIACILTGCSGSAENKPTDPLIQQIEKMISEEGDTGIAQAFSIMHHASVDKHDVLIPWLKEHESTLAAPFMMELGNRVFSNNPNEGLQWYMIGRVRAAYDVQRCTDPTSSQAISALIREYPEVFKYSRTHRKEYLTSWKKALAWEKAHPYTAKPTWICSHGIQAFQAKPESLVVPEKDWPAIRAKYLEESEAALNKHAVEFNKR